MKSVFISYKSEDLEHALRICKYLSWAEVKYWIDTERIDGGDPYDEIIPEIIPQYDVVLVLISKGSLESNNVANEIRIATKFGKRVIPFMLEHRKLEGPLSYHLESNNRIEAFIDWDSAVDRLIKQLKNGTDAVQFTGQEDRQKRSYSKVRVENWKDRKQDNDSICVHCPHCQSTMLKESESLLNAYIVDKRFAVMLEITVWLLSALFLWIIPESDVYISNLVSLMKAEATEPVMLQLLEIEPVAKAITLVLWGFIPVLFMVLLKLILRKEKANTETVTYHCVQCDRRFSLSIPKEKRELYYVQNPIEATAPDRIQRLIENIKKF